MLSLEKQQAIKEYVSRLQPTKLGLFFYYCLPIRKKVVLSNMQQVFSETLTPKEIEKLSKAFYSHVARFLFEILKLRFLSIEQIQAQVEVRGYEYLLEARNRDQGIALLAGHFGNWELSAIGGMLNFPLFRERFHVIRKTLRTKWLEKALFKQFFDAGIQVIPKQNALMKATEALDNKHAVIFIMDQYASIKARDGIEVSFFGKKTGTYKSLAMMVRGTDSVVIPVKTWRTSTSKHILEFHPPMPWISSGNEKEDLYINTEQYNKKLEEILLLHPEQWLWFHRRWKKL